MIVAALASGLLFGLGLAMSGMLDPARVLGFLDFAGVWDPSLAFVLGGAVFVSMAGTRLAGRMRKPALAERFDIPASRRIDGRLIGGSAMFGVGWGLAGFCPGPALAAVSLGIPTALAFVAAMLVGMWCFGIMNRSVRTNGANAASTAR